MQTSEIKKQVRDISYLASVYNKTIIQSIIKSLHPVDLVEILRHLSKEHKLAIFSTLDNETASEVLSQMHEHVSDDIIEEIKIEKLVEIAVNMDSDDVADLIARLPKDKASKVLSAMDKDDLEEVKELMQYDENSAGGLMDKEFISIYENNTVRQAIDRIRSLQFEDIYYVFVVDNKGVLVGKLALNKLILAPLYKKIREIMSRNIIYVETSIDQEEVALIARKYDLVAVPVVDEDGILVGRITIDDIVDVIHEEASEDIHKMAGITQGTNKTQSSFQMSKIRLPWLITGLAGGILAAFVISVFEHLSTRNIIILSFFIPVIMSMGGSVGIQSSTIMVRGLATGEISLLEAYKHLFKEFKIGVLNGSICGILLFLIAFVWKDLNLALLLAIALFSVMFIASIVGAAIPLFLRHLKIDPAIATGPFITISNDIIGLLIYFGVASLFL